MVLCNNVIECQGQVISQIAYAKLKKKNAFIIFTKYYAGVNLLMIVFPLYLLLVLGFDVAKTGDARIGFVGFPSVGKSTLLSNLAGVYSEVAAYEFTTLTTVPGVIRYKGAKIQV